MPLPTSASSGPFFGPALCRITIILAGSSEPRATASRAPILSLRMSSMSRIFRSSPVPLTASFTFSANTVGVKALAGVLTHSRIRLVASVSATASLIAADATFSPSSPMMLSASMVVVASTWRVLSDPISKLLRPMPSVTARARSAAPAFPTTSFGRTTAIRR